MKGHKTLLPDLPVIRQQVECCTTAGGQSCSHGANYNDVGSPGL
jgi:hypothetical protein